MKKYLIGLSAIAASATPALAHHPLGGLPMETFTQGVLSGIGHPLLGFDHLFFVIAVGIAALYTGRAKLAPAACFGCACEAPLPPEPGAFSAPELSSEVSGLAT